MQKINVNTTNELSEVLVSEDVDATLASIFQVEAVAA